MAALPAAARTRIDLVTFHFDKWGDGFYVEIAVTPPANLRPPIVGFRLAK